MWLNHCIPFYTGHVIEIEILATNKRHAILPFHRDRNILDLIGRLVLLMTERVGGWEGSHWVELLVPH